LATVTSICSGAPIPFDGTEIDRKLRAARSIDALGRLASRTVFDVYEHCALVVRLLVVGPNGTLRVITVEGDSRLAQGRHALRMRAIRSGRVHSVAMARPAGFRVVVAPLHDADEVIGLLEVVVPAELVEPKADRLALVARATSHRLTAWRHAAETAEENEAAVGSSFALGLRLAGVITHAGELGAAARGVVELLARELKSPVVAWRLDPTGETLRLGASSGLGNGRRAKLEEAATAVTVNGDRGRMLRRLHDRSLPVLGPSLTVVDGGPVVFAAGGHHAELELCGRELASLLETLPVASMASVTFAADEGALSEELLAVVRLNDLTPREREILALLASGASTPQISERLVISDKTVKTHVQNILRKLGVASRLEAAALATRAGYLSVSAS
jgi:DNA-binding CsgD family transcriptional regulator